MEVFDELWMFAVAVMTSALSISYYMMHKGREKDRLVQGIVAVIGGLIIFITLFFPWATIRNFQVSGVEIGEIFAELIKVQFVKVVTYFLLLLAVLTILGGFLHLIGYKLAREIIGIASGLALFLSVVVALALGLVPLEDLPIMLEPSPWICIFGGILGLISTKLER